MQRETQMGQRRVMEMCKWKIRGGPLRLLPLVHIFYCYLYIKIQKIVLSFGKNEN